MNQPTNNTTGHGTGGGFPSQPGSQTNPFTADLKGEFSSNFGTNTNAMSQIFKEGSYANQNRSRYILLAVLLVALAGFGYVYLESENYDENEFAAPAVDKPEVAENVQPAPIESVAPLASTAPVEPVAPVVDTAPVVDAAPVAASTSSYAESTVSGPVSINFPEDGAAIAYDETVGPARFSWNGGRGRLELSRSPSMRPIEMSIPVKRGAYSLHQPAPGVWFWRVKTSGGTSDVRSFTVEAPVRRKLAVTAPSAGGTLAATGGQVSWQGDSKITYYRVELTNASDWANPPYKFATAGSTVAIQGVTPGAYKMRVGAFSEISGRWEYSSPMDITVQ